MNTKSHLRTRMLCEGALMVALAQILGYLKLAEAPNGGSITFAMFPIILFAVRWGLRPGLMAGFLFGLLQLIFDGAYAWGWQSMLLDYLVAFTPLGLAGLFRGKSWGLFAGTLDSLTTAQGLRVLAACIPMALGGLLSAIAQGRVAAASINIVAKNPNDWSKGMVLCIIVEFYAILSLLISFLMLMFGI